MVSSSELEKKAKVEKRKFKHYYYNELLKVARKLGSGQEEGRMGGGKKLGAREVRKEGNWKGGDS